MDHLTCIISSYTFIRHGLFLARTCTILSSSCVSSLGLIFIRWRIMYLVLSVFPAPDSPLTRMHWFLPVLHSARYAWSALQNKCGGRWVRETKSVYSSCCYRKSNTLSYILVQIKYNKV